jgi:hypothetical protein
MGADATVQGSISELSIRETSRQSALVKLRKK